MLRSWYQKYKKGNLDYDPETGLDLFTYDTEKAVNLAKTNAKHVTDVLPKEELYEVIEPRHGSKSQLRQYIGKRGVESKLESFHLRLQHFGNRGSRRELVDALSLAGIAEWNLRIRHRLHLLKHPEERAWSRDTPSHLNHLYLELINDLAKKAGLKVEVYTNVRALPEDNGERFMSQYLEQQKQRGEMFLPTDIGRCACRMCSSCINIYAKDNV